MGKLFVKSCVLEITLLIVLNILSAGFADLLFHEKRIKIYSLQPKLWVLGSDLGSFSDLDKLKVSLSSENSSRVFKASIIASNTIVLELVQGSSGWVEFPSAADGGFSQPLFMTEFKYGEDILFSGAVQIATVLPTPDISFNDETVFNTATSILNIDGHHFNRKRTELYFDPPLREGTDFTMSVLSPNRIQLTKRVNGKGVPQPWRTDNQVGPLKIVAVNSGGGRLRINTLDEGCTIAQVTNDLPGHDVAVYYAVDSELQQRLYQSSPFLEIEGRGFAVEGRTRVQFGNNLKQDIDFTVAGSTTFSLTLRLSEASRWFTDGAILPAPLVIMSVDVGEGLVPQGPPGYSKTGITVATVFEDPALDFSGSVIYRTHTHSLTVTGRGFNEDFPPILEFYENPDLEVHVQVQSRTHMTLMLVGAWLPTTSGKLKVSSIDTGAGRITFTSPVMIAEVIDDSRDESGLSVISQYSQVVYESLGSPTSQVIHILGTGFEADIELGFDPPMIHGEDYELTRIDSTRLDLRRMDGRKWPCLHDGTLRVSTIKTAGREISIGGEAGGVKVAAVLKDPSVYENKEKLIYASYTRSFKILGEGLESLFNPLWPPKIQLSISKSAYFVNNNWSDTYMTLVLSGSSWNSNGSSEIRILSIDTGGGEVFFGESGILVATVQPDDPNVRCDDTCIYAKNGRCDDESVTEAYWNDNNIGWRSSSSIAIGATEMEGSANYASSEGVPSFKFLGKIFHEVAPCDIGTDCSDCGIEIITSGTCLNTCQHARDGACDDAREGGAGLCSLGSDCEDCGPVGMSNFTLSNYISPFGNQPGFDEKLDKDLSSSSQASYNGWQYTSTSSNSFLLKGDEVLVGQEGNAAPLYFRHAFVKKHKFKTMDSEGATAVFMNMLWAIVLFVAFGAIMGIALMFLSWCRTGGRASSANDFLRNMQ